MLYIVYTICDMYIKYLSYKYYFKYFHYEAVPKIEYIMSPYLKTIIRKPKLLKEKKNRSKIPVEFHTSGEIRRSGPGHINSQEFKIHKHPGQM